MSEEHPKPRALDLFAGAGGMTRGLQMAGFHVTGVDIAPQPHYVGDTFFQADALTFPLEGYDVIHASPPCQAYSVLAQGHRNAGKVYPDLLASIRERLRQTDVPWDIENVPGAPMRPDVILCGSMFGMTVRRHRWFEFWEPKAPWTGIACNHETRPVVISGNNHSGGFTAKEIVAAMEVPWMNRSEARQAIPPAYGLWIGTRLLEALKAAA